MAKKKNEIASSADVEKPLTEAEDLEELEAYAEEEERLEDADDSNSDDPEAMERMMQAKKNRSRISNIW